MTKRIRGRKPSPPTLVETTAVIKSQTERVDRASGIGGSDIGAVAGLSKWRTPFDVFLEKTGRAPKEIDDPDRVGRDPLFWGKALERPIMQVYEKREKRSLVYMFDEPLRHASRSWQIGSPDALSWEDRLGVDAKNIGHASAEGFGDTGTDQIPEDYFSQGTWYMSLLGFERWDFAVLISGQEYRKYSIALDSALADALLEIGFKFWRDHVQADTPPEVRDSETTRDYLRTRFRRELGAIRPAEVEEIALVEEWAAVRAQVKRLEKREADLASAIKYGIGDSAGIKAEELFSLSWKADRDSVKVDWEKAFGELWNDLALLAGRVPGSGVELAGRRGEIVHKYTTTTPGKRPLRPKFLGRLKQLGSGETE